MLPALIATLLVPLNPGVNVTGYQEAVLRALIPTPPVVIKVGDQGCVTAGHLAWSCAFPGTIEIAPEAKGSNPTFLHELGHQFDYTVMDGRARYQYRHNILHSPQPWNKGPNEMFAAAYSLCAQYRTLPPAGDYSTQYGYEPTPRMHTRTCRLIRATAARRKAAT